MSPFDPWLSTYPQGTRLDRPWWRDCTNTRQSWMKRQSWAKERIDGARVDGRGPFDVALLDAYDDAHPRPTPPPTCLQVWVRPDETCMVTGTNAVAYQFGGVTIPLTPDAWPPPKAVLVAGPHAPWAPKGWRP